MSSYIIDQDRIFPPSSRLGIFQAAPLGAAASPWESGRFVAYIPGGAMKLKRVTKNTVAAQVINQLTDLIKDGAIKPGERLPSEREMSEQLGVSRPPLREALRALEYAGMLETRYGDGVYVKSDVFPSEPAPLFSNLLNRYTLEEMIEMRRIVEVAAVRMAIERATTEDLDMLQSIHNKAQRSVGNKDKFIECDLAFHSSIAEVARNSILFNTVQTMRKLMSEFNHELLEQKDFRLTVVDQHQRICDAIFRRDSEKAVQAMERHLENVVVMAVRVQDGAATPDGRKEATVKKRLVKRLPPRK